MFRNFNQYKKNKDKYMVLVKNKTGIFYERICDSRNGTCKCNAGSEGTYDINSHMGIIKYGGRLWTLTYTKILKRELTVRFT